MQEFPVGSYWESLNHKGYEAGWIKLLQVGILDDYVNSKIPIPEIFANPDEGHIITQNTILPSLVKEGWILYQAAIYNSGTGSVYINIGTGQCGIDLYSGVILPHTTETIIWNKAFSISLPTDVYFSSPNWNGSILNTVIQTELIFI